MRWNDWLPSLMCKWLFDCKFVIDYNYINPTQVSSYQIDLHPSKYVPPTRKHKLQLISNKVYPLNWSWWRRTNVVLKILLWGTKCLLWISKLNAGSTKALYSHNIVYLRYMEGYIWLLFEMKSFACGRPDGRADRRVGEINAPTGPNWELKLCWVDQLGPGMAKSWNIW